jgi:pilus assembly protein CpaC
MDMKRIFSFAFIVAAVFCLASYGAAAEPAKSKAEKTDNRYLSVPLNRSTLVTLDKAMSEVMVANPEIADIHAHNSQNLTVVAKKLGRTNVRVFDKDGKLMREFDVTVTHDLPAIRRALKNFLPDETIGVEMVNTSIALTGQISNATVAEQAVKIVQDFARTDSAARANSEPVSKGRDQLSEYPDILNLMQVVSGQQVQLRVRVGEINREALKRLGFDLNYVSSLTGSGIGIGTGTGIAGIGAGGTPGVFSFSGDPADSYRGIFAGRWQPDSPNGKTLAGLIKLLEQEGLFKLLAEPNIVAISGEEAEFLAGGEIPIPVVQGTSGTRSDSNNSISIQYKPFGVAVKFTPFVLSENRIRMMVQPEVSEISTQNAIQVSGFTVPAITTRRAKTTVELAPGESYMIAGLIKDQTRAQIDQIPGAKELPVLGALFRSTEFRRNESELVIAVTPYVVDPVKSSDVKLPSDSFRPADQMEMFFYGAVGALSGAEKINEEALEGPVGFMVD